VEKVGRKHPQLIKEAFFVNRKPLSMTGIFNKTRRIQISSSATFEEVASIHEIKQRLRYRLVAVGGNAG